jgi:hypothetical protein
MKSSGIGRRMVRYAHGSQRPREYALIGAPQSTHCRTGTAFAATNPRASMNAIDTPAIYAGFQLQRFHEPGHMT